MHSYITMLSEATKPVSNRLARPRLSVRECCNLGEAIFDLFRYPEMGGKLAASL